MKIKTLLKKILLNKIGVTSEYYSQGREDEVINNIHKNKKNGFYIDVGAHHPVSFSNTYYFYSKGWNGICIEPNNGLRSDFQKNRPLDTFLNVAISDFEGEADLHLGKYDVHSSLIQTANNNFQKQKVRVRKLENICDEFNVPKNFDLLSIDTEGTEIAVLQGLNLNKYRPKNIIVEYNTAGAINSDIQPFLIKHDYQIIFINHWNMIFSRQFESDIKKLFFL